MQPANKRRYFTMMFVPHNEKSIISIRIPLYLFQALCVFIIISLVFSFFWIKSFQHLKNEALELPRLRAANSNLINDLDLLTLETEILKQKVEQIDELSMEICSLIELPPPEKKAEPEQAGFTYVNNIRALPSRGNNSAIGRAANNITLLQCSIPEKSGQLCQLKEEVEEYKKQLAATPSIWPCRGKISSDFGPRRSPISGRKEFHFGIDVSAPQGTPVLAAADGRIILAAYRSGYGNTVIIDHDYGITTFYAHLKSFKVSPGSIVSKGQQIGYVGSSGYSTGSHLHYEVHNKNVAVNPRDYLP